MSGAALFTGLLMALIVKQICDGVTKVWFSGTGSRNVWTSRHSTLRKGNKPDSVS